ncbi:E3 ubiquitin-protein ligase RHA1B [Vitis vinifera]|uniref:E3 ubiquitin-protein ligase RHA1B n=1 Tax=Vitis vinifera TaxID=29760 RepID=A0A438E1X6_VITVI|nr:E3 ubiquitin-protein ligase RHA1B [Vitis vinifera]
MAKEQWLYRSGFHQELIFSLFHFLGLSDFLETNVSWFETQTQVLKYQPVSTVLIREILPVMKFGETVLRRRHAVCLYDFKVGEEIRRLTNCKHNFHRSCLGRWMDHDQKTYLLCRTPFVPDEMQDEFNQRLWVVFGITKFYSEYDTVFGL